MSILNKLLRRGAKGASGGEDTPSVERSVFCSGCYQVMPERSVKVIPCFNEDVDKFVTTYRCGKCWMEAMDDTAFRLLTTDNVKQIASVADFFEAHGVVLLEYRRGDSAAEVRVLLLELLAKLRNGNLDLSIGETQPLDGV